MEAFFEFAYFIFIVGTGVVEMFGAALPWARGTELAAIGVLYLHTCIILRKLRK